MTWDEMVNMAARGQYEWWRDGEIERQRFPPWQELSKEEASHMLNDARAALLALREAGVRFMPEEATENMMEASARTHDPAAWDRMIEDALDHHFGEIPQWAFQAKMEAQRRYAAMLAAGEIKPVKEG